MGKINWLVFKILPCAILTILRDVLITGLTQNLKVLWKILERLTSHFSQQATVIAQVPKRSLAIFLSVIEEVDPKDI